MSATRESWGTRFGFIMAAAGSAVGLGNIWKFPYMAGANGGGAFLIFYLVFVLVFGLSLVIAELCLGRRAQRNPVGAFRALAGRAWPAVGGLGIVTAFVILSFYIVVAGWTLAYMVYVADGALAGANADTLSTVFDHLVGGIWQPVGYAALFMAATAGVVAAGVGRGIERMSKAFMPLLFLLLLILVVRAVTLDGAWSGVVFFVAPDFDNVGAATLTHALGQAFFSLSLGMGALITYGSYMPRQRNLPADALAVVALDTLVAVLAGFAVLPAMFAAGIAPGSGGPGTTFKVLPAVFAAMPAGAVFGFGFFLLLALAALTSAVSLLETVVCYLVDEWRVPRAGASVCSALLCFALSIPAALSFGAWQDVRFFGKTFFDLMDFASTSIMLPLGGLLTALCVGWVVGSAATAEVTGAGARAAPWARLWLFALRFGAPLGIAWILLQAFVG